MFVLKPLKAKSLKCLQLNVAVKGGQVANTEPDTVSLIPVSVLP